jgi:hypothetical protein
MALQWPEPSYVDGDFTAPVAVSLPVFSSPIRSTTAEYVFSQEWMVFRRNFKPTPLNTKHPSAGDDPDYSAYVLVSEGPRQDIGGGIVKWQRIYAIKPASHDEYESYAYPFIGFIGSLINNNLASGPSVTATGRGRITHLVTSRVQHDYFLVGVGAYVTPGDIPALKALRYFAGDTPTAQEANETEFIMDETGPIAGTSPDRTTYTTWISNAISSGWRSGAITTNTAADWAGVTSPGQFIAEDSRISRWNGNLWLRQTRFVLAQ